LGWGGIRVKRKLIITIDTEALPARASANHVEKLIWGEFDNGSAGIREICDVLESVGGIGLFFLDVAGSFGNEAAYREVNSYIERRGHIVEWHYHPEILGKSFWRNQGASGDTMRQDLFVQKDTNVILSAGYKQFQVITGRKPQAYRAGSFRWNKNTIDFLGENEVKFSFNACSETAEKDNYDTFKPKSPKIFQWANGVVEVPCGEININDEIIHLRFPRRIGKKQGFKGLTERVAIETDGVANILLHSWSFLSKDKSTGHFYYENSKRMDNFKKLLKELVKDGFEFVTNLDEITNSVT
jgi:hypothetical protein